MSGYIIKKIVLSSTALALFTGNITPPANETFYEDDSDFHKISSELNSGWGWSFNKAHASCDTEDMVECMNITGRNYNDDWDAGGWDEGAGDWTDANDGRDEGDDGGGNNQQSTTNACTQLKNSRPAHCNSMFGNSMFWPHTQDPSAFWNIPAATNGCGTGSFVESAVARYGWAKGYNRFSGNLNEPITGHSFQAACNNHDLCYNNSSGRDGCDIAFRNSMINTCGSNSHCQNFAYLYSSTVQTFGEESYTKAGLVQQCRDFKEEIKKENCS